MHYLPSSLVFAIWWQIYIKKLKPPRITVKISLPVLPSRLKIYVRFQKDLCPSPSSLSEGRGKYAKAKLLKEKPFEPFQKLNATWTFRI